MQCCAMAFCFSNQLNFSFSITSFRARNYVDFNHFGIKISREFYSSKSILITKKAIYFGFVNFRYRKIKVKLTESNRRNYFQNLNRKTLISNSSIIFQKQNFLAFAQRSRISTRCGKISNYFPIYLFIPRKSQNSDFSRNAAMSDMQCWHTCFFFFDFKSN